MGFSETTIHSSLAILATFLLLSTAAAGHDKHDKHMAQTLQNGDNNWPEAMTSMITAVIEKAKAGKAVAYGVEQKLPGDLLPQTKKSIDSTCKEAFDTLIFNLEQCVGFVKNDPTSALKHYLSSLTLFDCKNALEEFGVSLSEVNELDDELAGMSNNLVAVLEKNPAYL